MTGAAAAPGFAPFTVLRSWELDPLVLSLLVEIGLLYWLGLRIVRRGPGPAARWTRRAGAFYGGLAVLVVSQVSPLATYSERLLSVHMVQHLLVALVAPPLLLAGAPVTLALQAGSEGTRRRWLVPLLRSRPVRVLSQPILGWAIFAIVLWGSHFGPVYQAALGSQSIHALVHLAYLGAGLLFWRPIVAVDPAPSSGLSHPARILYLFLAMPQMAFLGLAIYSANHVLYAHYVARSAALNLSALADQHLAGAIMWESGMMVMVPAMAFVLFDWMARDEREAVRMDERLARTSPRPVGARPV